MDNMIGLVILNEDQSTYQILNQIGRWGPNYEFNVYESSLNDVPGQIHNANVAVKILPRADAGEMIWEAANIEVADMIDYFVDPGVQTAIFVFQEQFEVNVNGQDHLFIVFRYGQTRTVRRTLLGNQTFRHGLTMPCIRRALRSVVSAVAEIHNVHLSQEISAGNIILDQNNIRLGALCTAYEEDLADLPALAPHFLPLNRIGNWGRAPEYDFNAEEAAAAQPPIEVLVAIAEEGDIVAQIEEWQWFHATKHDIWNIGVVALELSYGQIQVVNRAQFLTAVASIQNHGILPNTWDQVLANAAAPIPMHPTATRFTVSFIDFVRLCLQVNPYERPVIQELRAENFLRGRMISEQEFVNRMNQEA